MSEKDDLLLGLFSLILTKVEKSKTITSIERVNDTIEVSYLVGGKSIIDIPVGKQGDQGIQGIQGIQGKQGIEGIQGKQGDQGIQGIQGIEGKKGDKGEKGEKGDEGEQGEIGIDGKKGEKGDKGDKGEKGEKGDEGVGIIDIRLNQRKHLIITTDDKEYDLGRIVFGGGGGVNNPEFTYTNTAPMPFDVGGYRAGSVFDKVPLKELWTKLLYGYDYPYFSDFIIADLFIEYEVGQPIDAGEYLALWTIPNPALLAPDTITIEYINEDLILLNNIANTGEDIVVLPEIRFDVPTIITFRISAFDTTGVNFNRTYSVPVKGRVFIGESIESVMSQQVLTSLRIRELKDDINGEYILNDGGYKWFCYPAFMGIREEFFDLDMQEAIAMEQQQTIAITNEYGVTQDYLCYRSFYELNGDIRIEVK